jgi:hypothetical protein
MECRRFATPDVMASGDPQGNKTSVIGQIAKKIGT